MQDDIKAGSPLLELTASFSYGMSWLQVCDLVGLEFIGGGTVVYTGTYVRGNVCFVCYVLLGYNM